MNTWSSFGIFLELDKDWHIRSLGIFFLPMDSAYNQYWHRLKIDNGYLVDILLFLPLGILSRRLQFRHPKFSCHLTLLDDEKNWPLTWILVIFRWWWHGVRIIIYSVTTIREDEQKNAPSGAGQCFDICGRLQFSPASFLSLWRGNRPEITMAGVRHTNYNGCCWQRSKQKIIFLLTCRNELVSSLCVLYSMTIIIMPSTILRPKFDFFGGSDRKMMWLFIIQSTSLL